MVCSYNIAQERRSSRSTTFTRQEFLNHGLRLVGKRLIDLGYTECLHPVVSPIRFAVLETLDHYHIIPSPSKILDKDGQYEFNFNAEKEIMNSLLPVKEIEGCPFCGAIFEFPIYVGGTPLYRMEYIPRPGYF